MADTVAQGKPRSLAAREDDHVGSTLPPLSVRYYRQMKPQRVSTVEVYWKKSKRSEGARGEVTVRLIVAGAQVLPSEQTINVARPGARAVFYVTPLAKGWLRNERLEILSQGRKVQEIPLATKVTSQRLTWFLLFCTFFVPWFISEFFKYGPMGQPHYVNERVIYHDVAKEARKHIRENVPAPLDLVKETPVEEFLLDVPGYVAMAYERVVGVVSILPIAYYSAIVFFCLTLISAVFHMPKRSKRTGKPISVLAEARV